MLRALEFRRLAKKSGTDKGVYSQLYAELLHPLRSREVNLLEVGVLFGASLALWSRYFPKALSIVGLDIFDPRRFTTAFGEFPQELSDIGEQRSYYLNFVLDQLPKDDRIRLFSVNTRLFLGETDTTGAESISSISEELGMLGKFDLIIDDGSHRQSSFDLTLSNLLPFLGDDGIYVVEDIASNRDDIVPQLVSTTGIF